MDSVSRPVVFAFDAKGGGKGSPNPMEAGGSGDGALATAGGVLGLTGEACKIFPIPSLAMVSWSLLTSFGLVNFGSAPI